MTYTEVHANFYEQQITVRKVLPWRGPVAGGRENDTKLLLQHVIEPLACDLVSFSSQTASPRGDGEGGGPVVVL